MFAVSFELSSEVNISDENQVLEKLRKEPGVINVSFLDRDSRSTRTKRAVMVYTLNNEVSNTISKQLAKESWAKYVYIFRGLSHREYLRAYETV